MKTTKRLVFVTLLLLAMPAAHLVWANGPVYSPLDLFDLILGIIENPDPIAQCHYVALTADPSDPDAREQGNRLDGRPVFEFNRATQEPLLAWAYDTGSDYDVAFNRWDGDGWDPKIQFIASSSVDELDPRLYVDRFNATFVTWWEDDGDNSIRLAKFDRWGTVPSASTVGFGRRPSVAVWQDDIVVSYERDRGAYREIVFARSSNGGPFIRSVVAVTDRSERLDPIVHVRNNVMWIDWKHDHQTMAFSFFNDGGWIPLRTYTWTDPSWVGELRVRHEIETDLMR
jgi:hypothetical protein